MEPLLEVKNLTVDFELADRCVRAVHSADLVLGKNETVVLAGESGSGKTVTALALTGILPRNGRIVSGEVLMDGRDLLGMREEELSRIRGARIAYIFQEPASYLNPVYTIGDQIEEAIVLHQAAGRKQARLKAIALLEAVRISDPQRVYSSYPHQLSGGMNQRAFIAMSLACRPAVLIADEPTTSLDVTIEAQIVDLLRDLRKSLGFSLLYITHNLAIARKIADRICVMYQGKVVQEGPTAEIFAAPRHQHTRELIAAYQMIGKL